VDRVEVENLANGSLSRIQLSDWHSANAWLDRETGKLVG
jgi:hypothetical protein